MATFQRAWALPLASVVLVTLIGGCGGGAPAPIPNQVSCCTVTQQVNSAIFVTETTADIHVANEHIAFLLGKTDGSIHSLQFDGQELLANGGYGAFDLNDAVYGFAGLGQSDLSANSYSVRMGTDSTGAGFADIAILHQGTTILPFTIRQHLILRQGEAGIHMFTEYGHAATLPVDSLIQTRLVLSVDPNIFTNASVEDDPIGVSWRNTASRLPTAAQLLSAPAVQDATFDLSGAGSAYPRRYYTKYDWTVYQRDHQVHGMYGNGFGAWICQSSRESLNGGPTKQDLTVHQTFTAPVLLVTLFSEHYGSPPLVLNQDWSKTFGPFFIYFNHGTDAAAMRTDALVHAAPGFDQTFYDTLGIPGYVSSSQRSTVTGSISANPVRSMEGMTVVLSDNGTDFQASGLGYQYWVDAKPDGSFRIAGVRPGTYRLSAYMPGMIDDFTLDNVVVGSATILNLAPQVWTQLSFGTELWTLGKPDRTALEYLHGTGFRNYWGVYDFFSDFSNGVNFVIGSSDPAKDWNYFQFKKIGTRVVPDWNIQFDLPSAPPSSAVATLTVAAAATHLASLAIVVNGVQQPFYTFPFSSNAGRRSGIQGFYQVHRFSFPGSLLKVGANTISLTLSGGSNHIMYDAIRLEIQ